MVEAKIVTEVRLVIVQIVEFDQPFFPVEIKNIMILFWNIASIYSDILALVYSVYF